MTLIKNQQGIQNCWVEYLGELLNIINRIEPNFADRLLTLPQIEEFNITPSIA